MFCCRFQHPASPRHSCTSGMLELLALHHLNSVSQGVSGMTELLEDGDGAYPVKEEMSNAITSVIGALLAIVGLYFLVTRATSTGDVTKIVTCTIFGLSLLIAYTASALYHGLTDGRGKEVMRLVDQVTIYLLIAGTYTPFVLVTLSGAWGWFMFAVAWTFAAIGITIKLVSHDLPSYVSTIPYLAMGWIALLAIKPMLENSVEHGWSGLLLVVAGGVFYSLGTIFYHKKRLAYNHAIWHLFVLAGSITHYFAVLTYVIPFPS